MKTVDLIAQTVSEINAGVRLACESGVPCLPPREILFENVPLATGGQATFTVRQEPSAEAVAACHRAAGRKP